LLPNLPRAVVAGLSGDAGKSLVTLGLARAFRQLGLRVAPFKKGPDFIDAAWLGAAAGAPGRNLDTYLMPAPAILGSLSRAARSADLALIEGNRGLFDGFDAKGSHSTAQLAKLIGAPIILVVSAAKVTRTVAAMVLGCRALDPELPLAGVILNRVATSRQEKVIRQALANDVGVPVLGAIPRLEAEHLPSRHLGLVCAAEHPAREAALDGLASAISQHVDVDAVRAIAAEAVSLPAAVLPEPRRNGGRPVRIGVLRDAAFSFYYPENLEALEAAGAELTFVSPLSDPELPAVDGLYAGGGFPEEHAARLTANESLRSALATAIAAGLPVWAECGGLMYLSRGLVRDGVQHAMVGALPVVVEHTGRPQGHGYVAARVDAENPFLPAGMRLTGHEFHYSRLSGPPPAGTIFALERGVGVGQGRDGIRLGNVLATYTHLHALGVPDWASSFLRVARGSALGTPERVMAFAGRSR